MLTEGNATINMSNINDGDYRLTTLPSTNATTALPQHQNGVYSNGKEDVAAKITESSNSEDLHRLSKPRMQLGFHIVRSAKIRSILSMIVVVGALIHARFLPQSIYDRIGVMNASPMNGNDDDDEATAKASLQPSSPYMIIIDGGSTGSRLHIFEFVVIQDDSNAVRYAAAPNQSSMTTIVERRGSFRTISPLSAFISSDYEYVKNNRDDGHHVIDGYYYVNKTDLKVNHILPLLQYIEQNIPKRYTHTTPIYYAATAGMRLLTESQQRLIYDTFTQIVMDYCQEHDRMSTKNIQKKDCFYFPRHHIQTLSGELEAYYGVLAANYLHGKIDTNLHIIHNDNNDTGTDIGIGTKQISLSADAVDDPELTVNETARIENASNGTGDNSGSKSITGALDMGGSSTQIVFYTAYDRYDVEADSELCRAVNNDGTMTKQRRLSERHFFSMSYLSYGVDQFRERLWNLIVYDYENSKQSLQEERSSIKIVKNPCSNPGHNVTSIINGTAYLLVGTGNVLVCKEHMKRIIPHPIKTPIYHIYDEPLRSANSGSNNVVGGIQHPSIYNESPPQLGQDDSSSSQDDDDSPSPDFLAMSLYFFTFDSIRVFTNDSIVNERWPKPTLLELENATCKYCAMNLVNDIYPLYDNDPHKQPHPYTRKGIVQHRCMEAIYMISLLETFGFTGHERHITFAFDVNGSEVEWTLGMALQYYSNNNNETDHDQLTCAWDGDTSSSITFTDHDDKKPRERLSRATSIVQRIRKYFNQIWATDAATVTR